MRTWSRQTRILWSLKSRISVRKIWTTWNWFQQNFRSSLRFEERALLSSTVWRCWTNTVCWSTQIARVNKFEKWSWRTNNRSCKVRIARVLPSTALWSTTQKSNKRLSIKVSESSVWLRTVSIQTCIEPTRVKCFRALLNRRPSAAWTSTLVLNSLPSRDAVCSSSRCQTTLTIVLSSMIRNWRNTIRLNISRASSWWTNSVYPTSSRATSTLTIVPSQKIASTWEISARHRTVLER